MIFCKGLKETIIVIVIYYNEIQISFGQIITLLEHKFENKNFYSSLIENVSSAWLNFIYHEVVQEKKTGLDNFKCGCTLRKTHDIPCACVIS